MNLYKKKLAVKLSQCLRNIELELAFVSAKIVSALKYCAAAVALVPLVLFMFSSVSMPSFNISNYIETIKETRVERKIAKQEEREAKRLEKQKKSEEKTDENGSKKLQDDLSMEMKGEVKSLKDFHREFFRDVYTPDAEKDFVMNSRRLIVLDKSLNTVFISYLSPSNQWRIYKFYVAGHGRNNGRKEVRGDRRTPEGVYFITDKRDNPLHIFNVYGPKAYVLNYPNRKDRAENRTGYGIWIHGLEPDSATRATQGCVVLENENLIDLDQYIEIGTPVYIVDKIDKNFSNIIDVEKIDKEWEYAVKEKEFLHMLVNYVQSWAEAWASGDIDKYIEFYAQKFMDPRGMDYNIWRDYKARIFAANNWIEVNVSDITPVEITEDRVVVEFLQHYRAPNMNNWGMKRLILVKHNDKWLIENELVVRSIS